ncbi:MAG: ATP-dependent 6-phosphofructokinase [Planctomycetota bacterium]
MVTQDDLRIATLGPCGVASPLGKITHRPRKYVTDAERVLHDVAVEGDGPHSAVGFERAGPREKLFFDPAASKAAIVTCGGLCPGLNNVIRNLFYTLHDNYGVPTVLGIRHGYAGLNPAEGEPPLELTHALVEDIHHKGGTILGTSRGPQEPRVTVDFLESQGVNLLFTIGGDGTQKGAHAIADEVARRGSRIAVVGIPKTIDNDIKFCYRTFGYLTAVAEAERVIDRAHVEARSVPRGVGLVKLMGREAGFIAAAATIASGEVNFTLIPEVEFGLKGERGFLAKLGRRVDARGHAVVVVAEGAGQHLLPDPSGGKGGVARDKSGNRKLGDIGPFLQEQITYHFGRLGRQPVTVKYFDPSYYIRSSPANAADSLLTEELARHAAHAGMAGKTDLLIGLWNGRAIHVPLVTSCGQVKRLDPERELWAAVLATTGQEKW